MVPFWGAVSLGRLGPLKALSFHLEVGNFSYRNVFATHSTNGVLTEESFKSVIRQCLGGLVDGGRGGDKACGQIS